MQNKKFEQQFNPEKYINDRLLEIEDSQERKQLRTIMESLFTPFYHYMENKYQKLEERFMESEKQGQNSVDIVTSVCRKDRLNVYEDTMFPICEEDLQEQYIKVEDVIKCLEEHKECYCYSTYGKMEYVELQNLWKEKRKFKGVIKTKDAEFEAYFILKRNKKYGKKVKELYEIFMRNQMPWTTLNIPFIYKMIDVYIVDASYPDGDVIESVEVDFEEYKDKIFFETIPVWNIGKKTIRSSAYPSFETDQINYTHMIYDSQLEKKCDYLVANKQVEYWNVRKESRDLCIECKEVEPVTWELLEVHKEVQCYDKENHPLMSNSQKTRKNTGLIRTFAELQKRITELNVDSYLKLYEIQKAGTHYPMEEATYSMDEAIEEELRVHGEREGLLFIFEAADKTNYLNEDILSYVISSIQWELREYQCFGKIM